MDAAEVIGPGTAISSRPRVVAQAAMLRAPLRMPASTTTVPADSAAMSRFRTRKRCLAGGAPGGYSVSTNPRSAMRSSRLT
jgi:hypothetical protein